MPRTAGPLASNIAIMKIRRPLVLGAAMLAAGLCGTAAAEERGLSDYVQGRYAAAEGELARAADLFEGALSRSPDDKGLLQQAFELAVISGDEELAVSAARQLGEESGFDSAIATLLATDALKRRDWDEMASRVEGLKGTGFGSLVAPVAEAWALVARGKKREAREALAGEPPSGLAKSYWEEHRGHVALATGRRNEAIAAYRPLIVDDEGGNVRIRLALAQALQKDGKDGEAGAILEAAQVTPVILAARADLSDRKRLRHAPGNARTGIATLLLRISSDLSRQRSVPVALTFARIATWLDPDEAAGWLMVSQNLARAEQYESALAAARQVGEDDPSSGTARAQEAALLIAMDRDDDALDMLKAAAAAPGARAQDFVQLGDAYQRAERYSEAIQRYRQALEAGVENDVLRWQTLFLIGASEEQRGDWQAAEVALREAMDIAPEQAVILNYLGYTLLDRGVKQEEAIELIEKAHALEPNDGHITDSLGWAHYQVGDYAKAVETLEKAIARVPGDATINDHLGDAYWQVGRHIEARFRWRAALEGEPSDEQTAAIEAKLAYGYDRGVKMATNARSAAAEGQPES
ncbi:tetratricopeptide repeat protein [Pacificimonas sp. WHA3]|uniref:Tetratricopeptide repeat protein n=1 Tax=Pacificimonas pallii TaxID=2827236 RepID=A0ABS6SDI5_9SPHN|nr:tetratricopeptide repeat protein [Pacificimonas pallii]MBV7256469.1 tetratricopeptide repeat protein [Pacificimonas pallii]